MRKNKIEKVYVEKGHSYGAIKVRYLNKFHMDYIWISILFKKETLLKQKARRRTYMWTEVVWP